MPSKVSDEDWALACEAIRGDDGFFGVKLPRHVENEILEATWALQDGFGPGVHSSEWDWSGIRDSSPAAKEAICKVVKLLLRKWNITIPRDKLAAKVKASQALRETLRAEMPELFEGEES